MPSEVDFVAYRNEIGPFKMKGGDEDKEEELMELLTRTGQWTSE